MTRIAVTRGVEDKEVLSMEVLAVRTGLIQQPPRIRLRRFASGAPFEGERRRRNGGGPINPR
jgi:hypothetical protein